MSTELRTNPFRVGTEIRDPADFVGRKQIIQAISGAMLDLQNVSLHGERRTGKTSLLLYLAHPSSVLPTGLSSNHIQVYLDFQGFAETGLGDVWQAIAHAIADQIRERAPNGQAESERFLATVAGFSKRPELFVTGLAQALAHLGASDLKFHLLFDEFEQTGENPNLGDRFYDALRSLPTRATNISYVIATRTGLAALQPVYNKASSPFFNIFTGLTLRPFQEDEVVQLILDYFARAEVDFSLAERLRAQSPFLYKMTGYHPFFLQVLCYHLYERLDQPDWPLGQARQEALQDFEKDSEPHFKYYWAVSSGEERALIEQLAVEQSIPVDWDARAGAARSLQDRCLIVQSKAGWQLFSEAFSRWVQTPAALYAVGTEYLNLQSWEEAIATFRELVRIDPGYKDVWQQLDEARKQAERFEELEDLYCASRARLEKQEWKSAIDCLKRIADLEGGYRDAAALLRQAEMQLELQTLYVEADVQLKEEKWAEAIKVLEKIVRIDRTHRDSSAKLDKARRQSRLQSLYDQALVHLRKERWPQAIRDLGTICEEDPAYRDAADRLKEAQKEREIAALYSTAVGYQATRRWEEAIDLYREVIQRKGPYKDVAHRMHRVQTLQERGRDRLGWMIFTELLRDPLWQGIVGVVATIGIVVLMFTLLLRILPGRARPTPTPKPATLCNGDFEQSFECWQLGGELDQSVKCDGNQCYAVLGNPSYICEGGVPVGEAWMKQSLQVPDIVSPTLSLRYRVFSYDLDYSDYFQVSVSGESLGQFGNTDWDVSDCSSEVWDSGWKSVKFDLSTYRGERVELFLRNTNRTHEWWNTWTYVDDVIVR